MGTKLPDIDRARFEERLRDLSPEPLSDAVLGRLFHHYGELRRWNERLSLIGPGTRDEILERHYGESLAALPMVPKDAREVVDLGSGAGFPGWVLAAARPAVRFTLIEGRQRKWAFLMAANRRASLSCECLNARVTSELPEGFPGHVDVVTLRALRLDRPALEAVVGCLRPGGKVLMWAGSRLPDAVGGLALHGAVELAGGQRRRILDLRLERPARPEAHRRTTRARKPGGP